MFFNKKNILLHTSVQIFFPKIQSSKFFIPSWFKKTPLMFGDKNILPYDMSYKACSVYGDSFISGYIIPLVADIAVKQSEGGPVISWSSPNLSMVELRPTRGEEAYLPAPEGFSENNYVWQTQHIFKIPKGYSALLTHPLNRYDLPFITLSGIVDGEFALHLGKIPFFVSKTFEGIIPAGTPMAQVILFKTENWESKEDISLLREAEVTAKKSENSSIGWYKKNIWKKKSYN